MRGRQRVWQHYASSVSNELNMQINNSYLIFEEEFNNPYDPNAIVITSRGEAFGTLGYVGKKFTMDIKEILNNCERYRIDMVDLGDHSNKEIELILSWK